MTIIVDRAPVFVGKAQSYDYLASHVIAGTITCSKLVCDGLNASGDATVGGRLSSSSIVVNGHDMTNAAPQQISAIPNVSSTGLQQYSAPNILNGYTTGMSDPLLSTFVPSVSSTSQAPDTSSNVWLSNIISSWSSANAYTTQSYTGTCTTNVASTAIAGEWAQLKCPTQYVLTSYSIDDPNETLKSWTLLGSNDGTAWNTIDTQNPTTVYPNYAINPVTGSGSFSYFRLVVTAVLYGQVANLSKIVLSGNKQGHSDTQLFPLSLTPPFDGSQFGTFRYFKNDYVVRLQGVIYNSGISPTASVTSGSMSVPLQTTLCFLDPSCAPSQICHLYTHFFSLLSFQSTFYPEYYPGVLIINTTGEVIFQQNTTNSGSGVAVFFDGLSFSTL